MHTIYRSQASLDIDTGEFLTEASTLGLKPGEWPEFIEMKDESTDANGAVFTRGQKLPVWPSNRFDGHEYFSEDRVRLVIFND